jgi:5,5'-dehydrodivanillate O-demethylase oxygenase subunit
MLTEEQNERLTRVGPGTPCGELLRRYWHPIAGASELSAERPKMRIRVLGEDLVLYRGDDGSYGLVAEQCSHRGASLYYGFVEGECIRCPYHGWLYDNNGKCVEQPFEPAQSMMRHTLRHPAYPVQKLGGFIWAYLGPEPAPLLPHWDILVWEHGTRRIEIRPQLNCNWLQAEENTADPTHTYFLHAYTMAMKGRPEAGGGFGRPFLKYGFQPFEWGLDKAWTYGGEQGGTWWGNLLIFPNMLRLENAMHWRVPIDDTHTKILRVEFTPKGRLSRGKPVEELAPGQDPPVGFEPTWLNEQGEYHLNTFSSQDGMAWETQGPIFDRTKEHLGAGDTGVMLFRQMLSDEIDRVAGGEDPRGLIRDPERNHCVDLASWLKEHDERMSAAVSGSVYAAAPPDLERREWSEAFDERYAELEIPDGPARIGVDAQVARVRP